MSRHVDKFERICGQMAHNNPTTPPTDENKIDWFLDSVTEKAYDSVHATCSDKLLEGELKKIGYPGRYYAVLRNTVVIPAIFGSKFEDVARKIGSNWWSESVERPKNMLKTLWLGV